MPELLDNIASHWQARNFPLQEPIDHGRPQDTYPPKSEGGVRGPGDADVMSKVEGTDMPALCNHCTTPRIAGQCRIAAEEYV